MNDALNWIKSGIAGLLLLALFSSREQLTNPPSLIGTAGGLTQVAWQLGAGVLIGEGVMALMSRGKHGAGEAVGVLAATVSVLVMRQWGPVINLIPGA